VDDSHLSPAPVRIGEIALDLGYLTGILAKKIDDACAIFRQPGQEFGRILDPKINDGSHQTREHRKTLQKPEQSSALHMLDKSVPAALWRMPGIP
jgi:hypothetical protein